MWVWLVRVWTHTSGKSNIIGAWKLIHHSCRLTWKRLRLPNIFCSQVYLYMFFFPPSSLPGTICDIGLEEIVGLLVVNSWEKHFVFLRGQKQRKLVLCNKFVFHSESAKMSLQSQTREGGDVFNLKAIPPNNATHGVKQVFSKPCNVFFAGENNST